MRYLCGRRLESGQTFWSRERRYNKKAYWPGLIWVQINTEGTWSTQVAAAMLKRHQCEVNPVINHKRLTALCVPGCRGCMPRGVQASLCPRMLHTKWLDAAQISNCCKITAIISTTPTSILLKDNSFVATYICCNSFGNFFLLVCCDDNIVLHDIIGFRINTFRQHSKHMVRRSGYKQADCLNNLCSQTWKSAPGLLLKNHSLYRKTVWELDYGKY